MVHLVATVEAYYEIHYIESIFRYYWRNRQWKDCCLIIAWFNGGFRHRRSRHFAAATRGYMRLQRRHTTVATIACRRSNAVCPLNGSSSCYLWSASTVRSCTFVIHSARQTSASSCSHSVWIITPTPMTTRFIHHVNQIRSSCFPTECASLKKKVIDCTDVVDKWMASSQNRINQHFFLRDGSVDVASVVRNLGATFDVTLSISDHVNRLVRSCYYTCCAE